MGGWSVVADRTSVYSSCNVYLSYGYVNVVGRTPKIVNISMVIDDVIDFFYLDVLVVIMVGVELLLVLGLDMSWWSIMPGVEMLLVVRVDMM